VKPRNGKNDGRSRVDVVVLDVRQREDLLEDSMKLVDQSIECSSPLGLRQGVR